MPALNARGSVALTLIVVVGIAVAALTRLSYASEHQKEWAELAFPFEAPSSTDTTKLVFPVKEARSFGSGGVLQVAGFGYAAFDSTGRTLGKLNLPDTREVIDVADDGHETKYALCELTSGKVAVQIGAASADPFGNSKSIEQKSQWRCIELPASFAKDDAKGRVQHHLIAGDGQRVVVFTYTEASSEKGKAEAILFEDNKWISLKLDARGFSSPYWYGILLRGDELYIACSYGEWGGKVKQLNTKTAELKTILDTAMYNITDMRFAPDGTLWIIASMSRYIANAALYSYSNGKLDCHCELSGLRFPPAPKTLEGTFQSLAMTAAGRDPCGLRKNWTLGPTTFTGLAFSADGTAIVCSSDYGLLSFANGSWTQLTPDWHSDVRAAGVVVTPQQIAVVPAYAKGLVEFDLKTKKYTFVSRAAGIESKIPGTSGDSTRDGTGNN